MSRLGPKGLLEITPSEPRALRARKERGREGTVPPRVTESWAQTQDLRSDSALRPSTALGSSLHACRAASDFLVPHSLYSYWIILRPDMQSLLVTNG